MKRNLSFLAFVTTNPSIPATISTSRILTIDHGQRETKDT
jgi:hypothetical protein